MNDLDYGEFHVSIKDYFTQGPYVASSGATTLDMPYEACEIFDNMYEAKASEPSSAKITFPSLIENPGLRELLAKIKEGNRVEVYNFQPDCGDPYFAGFIGPNGIEEDGGRLVLTLQDTLTQLRWQHIRKWERFNTNASGFFNRAIRVWKDLLNEDFIDSSAKNDYTVYTFFQWSSVINPNGYWSLSDAAGATAAQSWQSNVNNATVVGGVTLGVVGPWADENPITFVGSSTVAVLNGTTGYFSAPFSAPVHLGDTFAAGCWFKTSSATIQTLIDNGANDLGMSLDAAGHILITKVGASTIGTTAAVYNDGNWHFVLWTKVAAVNHLYVDGIDVTPAITNATIVASATPTRIGASQTPSNFFNGSLNSVCIDSNAATSTAATVKGMYAARVPGVIVTWSAGKVTASYPSNMFPTGQNDANIVASQVKITPAPGDTFLFEVDYELNVGIFADIPNNIYGNATLICGLGSAMQNGFGLPLVRFETQLRYDQGTSFPYAQVSDVVLEDNNAAAAWVTNNGLTSQANPLPNPQRHRIAVLTSFNLDGTVTVTGFSDGVLFDTGTTSVAWNYGASILALQNPLYANAVAPLSPFLSLDPGQADHGAYISVFSWRFRQLAYAVRPAGRFNPQTTDLLPYAANNEENLQLLQLIAEKDSAEYRPVYRAWPKMDELELDAVGTLGRYVSRELGYEQPPNLPLGGAPLTTPAPVIQDAGTFRNSPPFRFEEGYNLTDFPKLGPKANAHANDIIRIGASTAEAQVQGEKWQVSEVGRPQHLSAPTGTYPYFETIINDDRVPLQALTNSLAAGDLVRRIDPLPSIKIKAAIELPFTGRYRGGDFAYISTKSFRTNYEQEMRIFQVRHVAGRPEREIVLGRTEFDPSLISLLKNAEMISWLYDQAGTSPYLIPFTAVGNILTTASSADLTINLDQISASSVVIYAALHWFADARVLQLQPVINGNNVTVPATSPSGTDSGVCVVTGMFQTLASTVGQYKLHFVNNDTVTRNLTAAFLTLRVKG